MWSKDCAERDLTTKEGLMNVNDSRPSAKVSKLTTIKRQVSFNSQTKHTEKVS